MTPTVSVQFDYVRGNPDNLVGAGDADMGDIQGPFYDIRDYLNSGILDIIARSGLIVGEVRFLAVTARPAMWLVCDGSSQERALYPELFSAISTTYGPGSVPGSTFNVPDLRGRCPIGAGTGVVTPGGAAMAPRPAGQTAGEEAHLLAAPEVPSRLLAAVAVNTSAPSANALVPADGSAFNVTNGLDRYHNNMQPFTAIPAYIYAGAEP